MSESAYDAVAWGRKLVADRDPNWLGDTNSHRRAHPERVEEARLHFREIPFDSLTVVRTGADKYSLIDPDGVEYRAVGLDPLQRPDPSHQNIAGFVVDDGDQLLFLRRRGEHGTPTEVVVHGRVYGKQVTR
jgi:hypothetical protein